MDRETLMRSLSSRTRSRSDWLPDAPAVAIANLRSLASHASTGACSYVHVRVRRLEQRV
jgi:hypothetical protein